MARGRPQKEIDQHAFENLCGLMCTREEIAGFFDCSEDTIERWCKRTYKKNFAVIYKKYSARGKISLRRNQLRLSETNAAMAIFLGKNYLGQSDMVKGDGDSEPLRKLDEILKSIQDEADGEAE